MTIDEWIEKAKLNAKVNVEYPTDEILLQEAEEYAQLADWLEELKENRVALEKASKALDENVRLGYNKAIDKMKAIVKKHENTEKVQTVREIYGSRRYYRAISVSKFCRLADKLKESVKDE